MSIDMYLGASRAQAASVASMVEQGLQSLDQLESAANAFIDSGADLKGKAYDSARDFVSSVVMPLKSLARQYLEQVKEKMQAFPDAYEAEVASEDLKQSELEEEIAQFDAVIAEGEAIVSEMRAHPVGKSHGERLSLMMDSLATAREGRAQLQDKLDKLLAFNACSPQIFDGLDELASALEQGFKQANSSWDSKTGTFIIPKNRDWMKVASMADMVSVSAENVSEEALEKQEFIDSLPDEVRPYVTVDDVEITDDGFAMLTKPLYDILKSNGKTFVDLGDDKGPQPVEEIYDDHFIYGVKGDNGYVFSILKMREPSDIQKRGGIGVSLPFISTDIDNLFSFDGKSNTIDSSDGFFTEFQRVTNDEGQEADSVLLNYFGDTKSDGSYLMLINMLIK